MARKWTIWSLGALVGLFFVLTVAGSVTKVKGNGRIAPGIELGGINLSGLEPAMAEQLIVEQMPKVKLELICLFPPELQEEVEERVRKIEMDVDREESGAEEDVKIRDGKTGISAEIRDNKLYLTAEDPMVTFLMEETMEKVLERSKEVKVWEWLCAEVFRKPFRIRQVTPEFVWKERYFSEMLSVCAEVLEREEKSATVSWQEGQLLVTESKRGFEVNKEATFADAEQAFTEAIETLKRGGTDGVSVSLYVRCNVTSPKLTTETAKKCNTKIAEFTTAYQGAGTGRARNIEAGASHLHEKVILPGEEFSTAAALMPFTEENGYASGGTYINGELSESIGGGVCQLSTTLYNALLRTTLPVTERFPHSLPVGYIPLGQDAAIAGDYKDLCFRNTTDAPVLLLCEATGEEVRVTLYGTKETARPNITIESMVKEETKEGITVEVYRVEKAEGGAEVRELVSVNRYGRVEEER